MSLGTEQERFMRMVPRLIDHVHSLGYEIRGGDLFRSPKVFGHIGEQKGYGHKNSCHKLKLAIDLNLTLDGIYLQGEDAKLAHDECHDFWDGLGGSKRIPSDLNHYSIEYQGMR